MIAVIEQASAERNVKENKIEAVKKSQEPIDAFDKLRLYATQGYDAISEEDKSYFLKCFGIFDRPQTPQKFMIRVRIPGGQLSSEQARVLGEMALAYGNDYIDITTRMQVELRYLDIKDIPTVLEKLLDVGISTFQTGVDNFRNILTDPLDGLALDSFGSSYATLEKLQALFMHRWEWISALPRKFNTSISSSFANRCNALGQDCCFVAAKKEGIYGYNVYLGGKVGQIAQDANVFLEDEEEILSFFTSLMSLFKTYGFRDNRNKNRLYFLIEKVGMHHLIAAIKEESKRDFKSAGDLVMQLESFEAKEGRVALKDGTFALHAVVPSGIFSGTAMIEASKVAQEFGKGMLRLTVDQNLYIIGVEKSAINAALESNFFEKYKNINTPYLNHMIACAGSEHCPFGVIPNKPDAIKMSEYLSSKVPLDEGLVRMYWSGCVKGCGIHALGDIGFEGCKVKVESEMEYGVHIFVGGKLTGVSQEGHTVLKSVPLRFAPFYVEQLMIQYKNNKKTNESFERFYERVLSHFSSAFIGFLMHYNAYNKSIQCEKVIDIMQIKPVAKIEAYELFELGKWLYKQHIGSTPYDTHEALFPSDKVNLQSLLQTDSSLDPIIAQLIESMISPKREKRALVFSELLIKLPHVSLNLS